LFDDLSVKSISYNPFELTDRISLPNQREAKALQQQELQQLQPNEVNAETVSI